MNRQDGVLAQLKRNSVALISLAVALLALGYNTWRNETTERQRNVRHAAFLLIEHTGRLQSLVNAQVYARDENAWIEGWGEVLTIRALGTLLPDPVPESTETLFTVWEGQADSLAGDAASRREADRLIFDQLRTVNTATLAAIQDLD